MNFCSDEHEGKQNKKYLKTKGNSRMPKTATGLTTTIQNEEIRKYLGNYSQKYYIGTFK